MCLLEDHEVLESMLRNAGDETILKMIEDAIRQNLLLAMSAISAKSQERIIELSKGTLNKDMIVDLLKIDYSKDEKNLACSQLSSLIVALNRAKEVK